MNLDRILIEETIQLESAARKAAEAHHPGVIGAIREQLFKNTFGKSLLPKKYGIGSGFVVSPRGRRSRQTDVIFFDALECPAFLGYSIGDDYPTLGVHGMAEIKSTLTRAELKDAHEKIVSFKQLFDDDPTWLNIAGTSRLGRGAQLSTDMLPFGIVFAYDSDASLEAITENLFEFERELSPKVCCNLVVVLRRGIVMRVHNGVPVLNWSPRATAPFPRDLLAAKALGRATLAEFYPLLINLLASVETFPVDPSLYRQISRTIDGTTITGQIQFIDDAQQSITQLTDNFLRKVMAMAAASTDTTIKEIENTLVENGRLGMAMPGDTTVRLFDPDGRLIESFPVVESPLAVGDVGARTTLWKGCLFLNIGDNIVVVPRAYAEDRNVITESLL